MGKNLPQFSGGESFCISRWWIGFIQVLMCFIITLKAPTFCHKKFQVMKIDFLLLKLFLFFLLEYSNNQIFYSTQLPIHICYRNLNIERNLSSLSPRKVLPNKLVYFHLSLSITGQPLPVAHCKTKIQTVIFGIQTKLWYGGRPWAGNSGKYLKNKNKEFGKNILLFSQSNTIVNCSISYGKDCDGGLDYFKRGYHWI